MRHRQLIPAVAASLLIILSASFVGELRAAIQQAFPGQYRTIVGGVVAGAVIVGLFGALRRIRERRAIRFTLLATALGIGAVYAWVTRTGNPDVDAVERFHFVEYGVLALLFHRVWMHRADVSALLMPMLAGIVVGTLDELVQWFIPQRIGEIRDVALNGVALACGVLFGTGLRLPRGIGALPGTGSRRSVAALAAATVAAIGFFFSVVHLGHTVTIEGTGSFRSRFTAGELSANQRDRARGWRAAPPVRRGLAREDQYLSEAEWHIQERNRAWGAGDMWRAWHENAILETFYAPATDIVLPDERWPDEQRADARARATPPVDPRNAAADARFTSDAHPFPIYLWSPISVGTLTCGMVVAVLAFGFAPRQRARMATEQAL